MGHHWHIDQKYLHKDRFRIDANIHENGKNVKRNSAEFNA